MTEELKKEIEKRNALFENADASTRRVLVAKDAKEQILSGRFVACSGSWVRFGPSELQGNNRFSGDVQSLFLEGAISECRVCGLGSLMLSAILFTNNVHVSGDSGLGYHRTSQSYPVRSIFDTVQLRLVELAFELGSGNCGVYCEEDENAVEFGEAYTDLNERLIAILNNIIKNNGTFIP